jgi:hypothetical protein
MQNFKRQISLIAASIQPTKIHKKQGVKTFTKFNEELVFKRFEA